MKLSIITPRFELTVGQTTRIPIIEKETRRVGAKEKIKAREKFRPCPLGRQLVSLTKSHASTELVAKWP